MSEKYDHIDLLSNQWRDNHKNFEHEQMEVISRLSRLNKQLESERLQAYKRFNINSAEFDVLATLYRNGEPYNLLPSELLKQTLLTSGAMTNRLERLEVRGLLIRTHDLKDRRRVIVKLTELGLSVAEKAVESYFDKLKTIYDPLTKDEVIELNYLLKKWSGRF